MSVERVVPPARPGYSRGVAIPLVAILAALTGYVAGQRVARPEREVLSLRASALQRVAIIREAPCDGGRCHALWLGHGAEDAKRIATFAPGEVVEELAWSGDGSLLALVVNGYQLRVFDPATAKPRSQVNLLPPDGPPSARIVRGITFSANGAAVTFDECPRSASGCKSGMAAIR